MGKNDLFEIAIAAAFAVIFKELFSWLVRKSKPVATIATKISGKWISEHIFAISFATDFGIFIGFTEFFFIYPYDDSPVTYKGVRSQILMVILLAFLLYNSFLSFKRWVHHSKPN